MTSPSETLTVVFVDIVSSTELMASVGDEAFDELRQRFVSQVSAIVEASSGTIVKSLGDGVMARFSASADGLAAAVAVQRSQVGTLPKLGLRIGISVGDVKVQADGDCHGTPVVEAARLCAAAEPGTILATDVVAAMVRGRARDVQWHDVGALELKGLPEAVRAVEVEWRVAAPGTGALPRELEVERRVRLAGRHDELDRVMEALAPAWDGQRAIALVSGEPGIGKTRLSAECAAQALAKGAEVLAGRCLEELIAPFVPWHDIVGQALDVATDVTLNGHVERHRGVLTRIVPAFVARFPGIDPAPIADPATERLRVAEAIDDLLAAIAAESRRPLLVVLEDLHWAEAHCLSVLTRVMSSPRAGGIAVIGTYRDTDLSRSHPLAGTLVDLRRSTAVTRVDLQGLDEAELTDLVDSAAGQAPGSELVRVLHDETEGNPFFVLETLQHLVESGSFAQVEDRWVATRPIEELGVPEGVREVIGKRLSRLPDGVDGVLRVAAVAGRAFELDIIEPVCGGGDVLAGVEAALAAGLVVEGARPGEYSFSHSLIRHAVLDEVSMTRRVRVHWALGESYAARRPSERDRAVFHLFEGILAGDAGRAVDAALDAGEEEMRRWSLEAAELYFDRALTALEGSADAERRWRALNGRATTAMHHLDTPTRTTAFLAAADLAAEHHWVDRLTHAVECCTVVPDIGAVPSERIEELFAQIRALRPDGIERVLLLVSESSMAWSRLDFPVALARATEALTLARESHDPSSIGEAATAFERSGSGTPTLDDARALADEVQAVYDAAPPGTLTWHGYDLEAVPLVLHFLVALQAGDRARVDELLARAETEMVGGDLFYPAYWRCTIALMEGRLHDADRLADEFEHGFPGFTGALIGAAGVRAETYYHRDDPRGRSETSGIADLFGPVRPAVRLPLTRQLFLDGDVEEAREIAAAAGAMISSVGPYPGRSIAAGYLAEVSARLGEPTPLAGIREDLEARPGTYLFGWGGNVFGPADLARAQIALADGRVDDAVALADAALTFDLAFGARGFALRSRRWLAAALLARDAPHDRAHADACLDEAQRDATELGYASMLRDLATLRLASSA